MNTLTILYKSGESRILHPTKDFFKMEPVATYDKKAGTSKMKILSMGDKCMDLAYTFGEKPYKILLEKDSSVEYTRTFHGNEPEPIRKQEQGVKTRKFDETAIKRALWNRHKKTELKTIFHGSY